MANGVAPVDGGHIAYELRGAGPDVVLVHGFSLDRRMWDDQLDAFSERFRVLRYDVRGFGESTDPDPATSPASDLAAVLRHCGIERTAVVGLSMGGGIAIDFALDFPATATALVAANTALSGYDWPHDGRPSAWHAALAASDGLDAAKRAWLASALFAPARERPDVARRLADAVADYGGWHWLNAHRLAPPATTAIDRLGDIACPTLVLTGERDLPDFHAIARLIETRAPGAISRTIPGAGHMSNLEAPAAFNDEVLSFLDTALGAR